MTLARRDPPNLGTPADLHQTWRILAGGAQSCAETLIGIAQNGRLEADRIKAAVAVLQMTGFKAPDTVQVLPPDIDPTGAATAGGDSPAARIRNRLATLSASRPEDDEITDAVIVEVDEDGYEVVDAEPGNPGQT